MHAALTMRRLQRYEDQPMDSTSPSSGETRGATSMGPVATGGPLASDSLEASAPIISHPFTIDDHGSTSQSGSSSTQPPRPRVSFETLESITLPPFDYSVEPLPTVNEEPSAERGGTFPSVPQPFQSQPAPSAPTQASTGPTSLTSPQAPMNASTSTASESQAYGTLLLGQGGRSKYLGPTAGSEWLKDVSVLCAHSKADKSARSLRGRFTNGFAQSFS